MTLDPGSVVEFRGTMQGKWLLVVVERFAAAHLQLYRGIAGRPMRLPGEGPGHGPPVVSPPAT